LAGKFRGTSTVKPSRSREIFTGVLVARRPSVSTGRVLKVPRGVPVEHVRIHPAKTKIRQAGEELPERPGIDDVEIEQAVVDGGILGNGQATAMIAAVADADLIDRPGPSPIVVDIELDEERLEIADGLQQRDGIGEHPPPPFHLLALGFDDLRGDPDARDVEIGFAVGQTQVDLVLAASERGLCGLELVAG
jgi:hypothetical protein